MGLLDRIDKNKQNIEMPQMTNFEFGSIEEDEKTEILGLWKRLFIRGTLGDEEEYNSQCNVCVRDRKEEVICIRQGENEQQRFFGLIIKGEMWTVTCLKGDDPATGNDYTDVDVVYIPSKIGKISTVNDSALEIARVAVKMLSGELYDVYVDGLKAVLDEESVKEYTQMEKSWYEQIFADENCKQLKEYQSSKLQTMNIQSKELIFEYELVDEQGVSAIRGMTADKIKYKDYVLAPRICVKEATENIRCFKLMKNVDFSNLNDIQYYLMQINAEVMLVGTVEIKETGDISIEKVTIFGESNLNVGNLDKTMIDAIKKIQEVWYNKPSVRCAEQVHTEKCPYTELIQL